MQNWKAIGTILALVGVGVLSTAAPGQAQRNDRANSPVGYVDLAQVTDQLKKTTAWAGDLKRFEDERQKAFNELKLLNDTRYLSPSEREELRNLSAKPRPSSSEEQKIKDLLKRSDELDREFQTLSTVDKPTPAQDARLRQLTMLRETGRAGYQDEEQKRQAKLSDFQVSMLKQMDDRIRKIVEQVAEARKLTLVVDAQLVWYGGQDITPDVLKKLPSQ